MKKISMFIDSGAHSLYTREIIKMDHTKGYEYYDTDEFYDYVDEYASFVKKNKKYIDVFVNVDVIFNPEKTWEIQTYMEEEHNLRPLPVVHYGSDIKWVFKYMDKGYDYIGIGGLGQEVTSSIYTEWADKLFDAICDTKDRTPMIKTHGFALTAFKLMLRYPWWSVDSTTWLVKSRHGKVCIPAYDQTNKKWRYDIPPLDVGVSNRDPGQDRNSGLHIRTLSPEIKKIINLYLEKKNYVIGRSSFKTKNKDRYELKENERWVKIGDKPFVEVIEEEGLCNSYIMRDELNIIYYLELEKHIKYPRPFIKTGARGLF